MLNKPRKTSNLSYHIIATMPKTVVYAIGGNALQNPAVSESNESAEVLAKVMSDVVDLLESGGALS